MKTAQIGRCGELLVQYHLLLHGIESSAMTTDSGVDLVAYSPRIERALTIQVKTNLRPKRAGGTGRLALDWWLRQDSPAELVALVDLSTNRIWMLQHGELVEAAQQRPQGRLHFYFYVEDDYRPKISNGHFTDYTRFQLANRVTELFGVAIAESGLNVA